MVRCLSPSPREAMDPGHSAFTRLRNHADGRGPGDVCQVCGLRARVRVLLDYRDGQPVLGQFCLTCADGAAARYYASSGDPAARREWVARLCMLAGVAICAVAALGDFLNIAGHSGFGWQQRSGILIGIMLVILAALLRIDVFAIAGAFLLALSALADVIHVGQSAGFGWKQEGCIIVGIAVLAVALYLRRNAAGPRRA